VVNYLNWCRSHFQIDCGQGAPVFTTPAADLTVTSLLGPLIAGRTITLVEGNQSPERLASMVASGSSFSLIKMTPAHLKLLVRDLEQMNSQSSQGCLVLGGEALSAEDLAAWRSCFPGWRIFNEYGPTEASVGCCVHEATEVSGIVPIGKPIANVRLYVLDDRFEPLPQGFPGELYIGGPCLARGYHDRGDLSAQRFLPDPFSGGKGQRLYKTGDRVRFTPGDNPVLEFLGRNDAQVKIRGYRVELGEIEACLKKLAFIDDAVVSLRGDRLAAYLTGTQDLFVDQLRETLAATLPEHMIPAFFISLQQFPLTPNGKVDRRALPEPDSSRPQLAAAFVLPSTPLEHDLADVWRQALGIDAIGIHDNFFSLGGDSIRTVRAAARAAEKGLEIAVQDFFRFPTIAQLADHLGQCLAEWDEDHQLLAEIEGMSDEQAAAMLAKLETEERL
jgi:acyl-coenzyme A synthetase/AMP-(fatty) acid ligase